MTTKTKAAKKPKKDRSAKNGTPNAEPLDVMTLAEAAAYLRVAEAEVVQLVQTEGLIGRQVGAQWRFLKRNLELWLSTPAKRNPNEALLALAGTWKDDPDAEQMLKEIYERRRQTIEEE
jgi:excisionase family DNA binding protein